MDKLTAIKIKYDDNTYSDEIPISVLAENVEWDSTHTLVDILGSIDVDATGTIQDQINHLFNEKVSPSELNSYVASQLSTDATNWLNTNVNPVGSAVVVDNSLTISGAAADAKATGNRLSNNLNNVFSTINICKKDASRNRYISFKGTKAFQNKVINSRGGLDNGTGSGNNWTSDLIKIPFDKRDIIAIAIGMDILWCAAFYDDAINFLSFFENQSAPTYGRVSERQKNIQIPNNAEYIRFGFYSSTGYSEDKYYNKFKLFSILEAQFYADNDELATHCLWGMTLPDSNRNITYAANTVGLLEYAKFEKPVIVTAVTGYKIAAILKDPDKNNNTTSSWFSNGPIFIPAGFNFWVGIRPIDSNADVYLPENICEQVSIKYADSRFLFPSPSITLVKNGYALFGQMSANRRCGLSVFERADEDILFGPTSSDS